MLWELNEPTHHGLGNINRYLHPVWEMKQWGKKLFFLPILTDSNTETSECLPHGGNKS